MALNVRKGDTVLVIAGKDKGKTGKVLVAMPANNSVVVAGVNIVSKHKKPRSAQDKGGIIKKENKIDASNVQIVCPTCNKATRVASEVKDGKKTRICKKCGASLDVVAKKATKETKTTTKKAETTKTTAKAEPKTTAKKVEAKAETKTAEKTVEKKAPAKKTTATKTATKTAEEKKTTTKKTTTKKVETK